MPSDIATGGLYPCSRSIAFRGRLNKNLGTDTRRFLAYRLKPFRLMGILLSRVRSVEKSLDSWEANAPKSCV